MSDDGRTRQFTPWFLQRGCDRPNEGFKSEMASFGQVSFQTTSPHPNSGFGAATFCNQQETWQRDRGRSALPQQLKAAALHNDTAVLYGNRTTQPTTPSCKLKLVLWKTETRHTPDGYAGMSHVHHGSLLEFNYRTGAGKIIKKKKCLSYCNDGRWNVPWEEHLYPVIVLWLHLTSSASFRREEKWKTSLQQSATTKLM